MTSTKLGQNASYDMFIFVPVLNNLSILKDNPHLLDDTLN